MQPGAWPGGRDFPRGIARGGIPATARVLQEDSEQSPRVAAAVGRCSWVGSAMEGHKGSTGVNTS